MLKKEIFFVSIIFCLFFVCLAKAQLPDNVYLDLKEEDTTIRNEEHIVGSLYKMGKDYINDVKEYNELLEGKSINKDFSDDIKNKYNNFDNMKSEEWTGFVRNGVKVYRFYKDVKSKIVEWFMSRELPIVVADDQYEMGEDEEYIKSDTPLVIEDFKKVVAYSGKERDVLAAKEKRAKDEKKQTPSEFMTKIKKYIIEKEWQKMISAYVDDFKDNLYEIPDMHVDSESNKAKAVVLTKYHYSANDGKIEGVILVEPEPQHVFLLSSYEEYEKASIKFDSSKNIKDLKVDFIVPQQLTDKNKNSMLVYTSKFPIYFEAKVIDETKDVLIKPSIDAHICHNKKCEKVSLHPDVKLKSGKKGVETLYSAYVTTVKMNVPNEIYKDRYEIGDLVWEKKNDGTLGSLRLGVKTSNVAKFDIMIISDDVRYFAKPRYSIDENGVVVRFDLSDMTFNPSDKEISFLLSTNGSKVYKHKQKVKEMSYFDTGSGKMSVGILGFAFLGGILLNLMPCVFPVLFLKLLGYTKLGKLKASQIRTNFILNVFGILLSFIIIAMILVGLKMFGYALGWGMQFQNIYFLATVIWLVIFFLYYVSGIIDFKIPVVDKKIKHPQESKLFEFLSGVFLVVLSTPCMAPYLGTAFGVALAGDIKSIISTVMFAGLGLSVPYILITIFPKIAFYFPKPGKWMVLINMLMVLLLFITFIWLMSILIVQTSLSQIWHWLLYISFMSALVYFWKHIKNAIRDVDNKNDAVILYKKFRMAFYFIVLIIVGLSFIDVGYASKNRQKIIEKNYETELDLDYINGYVKNGNQVLVKVGADWCLTCKYNEFKTFDIEFLKNDFERYNLFVIDIDWTKYQHQVLRFMQKFGRSGLPFYVLFSERYPDGIVLPEIVDAYEMLGLIER